MLRHGSDSCLDRCYVTTVVYQPNHYRATALQTYQPFDCQSDLNVNEPCLLQLRLQIWREFLNQLGHAGLHPWITRIGGR